MGPCDQERGKLKGIVERIASLLSEESKKEDFL